MMVPSSPQNTKVESYDFQLEKFQSCGKVLVGDYFLKKIFDDHGMTFFQIMGGAGGPFKATAPTGLTLAMGFSRQRWVNSKSISRQSCLGEMFGERPRRKPFRAKIWLELPDFVVSFWVGGTGGKFFEGLVKGQNSPKVLYESHLGFGLVQNHNESDSFWKNLDVSNSTSEFISLIVSLLSFASFLCFAVLCFVSFFVSLLVCLRSSYKPRLIGRYIHVYVPGSFAWQGLNAHIDFMLCFSTYYLYYVRMYD